MKILERLLCRQAKQTANCRFRLQGLFVERVQGLKPLEGSGWTSYSNDPYFLMRAREEAMVGISITFSLPEKVDETCYLYYGYEKDGGEIFPENRIWLPPERCKRGMEIIFEHPVSVIRLDPLEQQGYFKLEKVHIAALPHVPPVQERMPRDFFVCSIDYGVSKLAQRVRKGEVDKGKAVLFITHEMTATGAPQLCAGLLEEFVRRGYIGIVLSLQRSKELYDRFEKNAEWIFFAQTPAERMQVLKGLAEIGICKALCNTVVTGCCAELLAQNHFFNLTLIHEMEISSRLNASPQHLVQIAEYADHIIFPARIVEEEFFCLLGEKHPAGEYGILPQGLYKKIGPLPDKADCARWVKKKYGIPVESKIVLCAGAQGIVKGTDLIPLLAQLLKRTKLHFLWLGNCNDRLFQYTMQKMLRKMGLTDCVHFEEYVSDAADYAEIMAGADVFLLPSREDSYPSVLLEAMACGTVTLAFEGSGGAQELLQGGAGVLVPYLDLEQMAQAIQDIAEHPSEYKTVQQKAIQTIKYRQNFTSYAGQILKILFPKEKA